MKVKLVILSFVAVVSFATFAFLHTNNKTINKESPVTATHIYNDLNIRFNTVDGIPIYQYDNKIIFGMFKNKIGPNGEIADNDKKAINSLEVISKKKSESFKDAVVKLITKSEKINSKLCEIKIDQTTNNNFQILKIYYKNPVNQNNFTEINHQCSSYSNGDVDALHMFYFNSDHPETIISIQYPLNAIVLSGIDNKNWWYDTIQFIK